MDNSFELGDKVVDPISGFAGVVTARAEYLGATPRVQVTGLLNRDGEVPDHWIDEARCRLAD